MKKWIALFLSLVLLLSLAACGGAPAVEEPADQPVDVPAVEEPADAPADEPAEAPAEEREHVTLSFYARVNEQPDEATVFAAFNEYCEEKLNTTVEWNFLGGTFSDKVAVMINSGEQYDAVWTSNWQNDYATNVARGAYVDLTDMLVDYPELYASMPQGFWDATKIEGRIYAVPCQQIAARSPAMSVITEYAEAFGMTREQQLEKHRLADFEEYIQFCFENYGAKVQPYSFSNIDRVCGYEFLNGQTSAIAVKVGDPECKVVNLYATEEFKESCNEMAYLYEQGWLDPDLELNTDYMRSEMIAGRVSLTCGGTFKPGGEAEESNTYGIGMRQTPMGETLMNTDAIIATMWSISSTSEHPDRALEVLALLSTDAYAMQLISFGVEGVHYTVNGEGFMEIIPDAGFNPSQSWAMGNVFLTTPMVGQPANVWEETAELNANANVSTLIGYTFSVANVEAEVTNVTGVVEEYKAVACGGLPVEETLEAFNAKLEAAGIDVLIAEAQAQIDAFLASK